MSAVFVPRTFSVWFETVVLAICLAATLLATACGTNNSGSPMPKLSGNTNVTVLLSSTANDQVTRFAVELESLTLTSQSGNNVTVLPTQQPAEFMHLNGEVEPLTTLTVPQDIYTSATATVGAVFVCLAQDPSGGIDIENYSINQAPMVNLASPMTITGSNMGLLLSLQVADSAVFSSCATTPPFQGFSLTPTFNLTPFSLSASPTNAGNGKVNGLDAVVASVGSAGASLTLTIAGGQIGTRTLTATSNNQTVFQGISGASALSPGMLLNMDGAIQADGSLLATRITVADPTAINLFSGPIMMVDNVVPTLQTYGRTELGPLQTINNQSGSYFDIPIFDFSSATFNVSGQFTNLQSLPFVPSFTASNMVAGQNVDIATPTFVLGGGVYTPANTITLVSQIVDGTVMASQQSGSFVDYTISLAPYDLFPTLAVQQGQTTLLNNPSQVEVYVDGNTQQLNKQSLAAGSTLRFYGLVFNDNGTLRMDCAQVSDGVSLTPQTNSNTRAAVGPVQTVVVAGPGTTKQISATGSR